VGEEFRKWVLKVRGAAMTQAKFGELAEAIIAGRIKEGVAYKARTLAEILWPDLAMGGEKGKKGQNPLEAENALYRKERAISSPSGRKALADIAQSCGLRIRMQKVAGADGSTTGSMFLRRTAFEQGWEVPANTLAALSDGMPTHPGGVGAPMAEPHPPNGQAPMPEVQTPTPAPEPVPMAAKGTPTGVGGGVPMAPPAPEKPMAIAVQSAQSPKPTPPTPEQRERAIAKLRETLTRLPKPAGILQQRGPLIEGVYYVPAPRI
jgi:hypothetical protein